MLVIFVFEYEPQSW